MPLKNNPFYLLKVSYSAGRREIVSASDETGRMPDAEACSSARDELFNPDQRLAAEMDWFMDAEDAAVERIRTSIENDEPISTEGLSALSRLNAMLHNFSLSNDADSFELGFSILELNENYAALDAEVITDVINRKRNEAEPGPVQVQAVIAELDKKREAIRRLITEKLSALDQDAYIELVTMLAEKHVSRDEYSDGAVLTDVIDQYEARMRAALEASAETIEKHIGRIKGIRSNRSVTRGINSLIREVRAWEVLARPLQIRPQASGIPCGISGRLETQLRDLSLDLYSGKAMPQEAMRLINAMKAVFAESGAFSDLFDNDSGRLKDPLKEKQEAEGITAGLNALQQESRKVQALPGRIRLTVFVNRIIRLDQRIIAMDLAATTGINVRENLYCIGRDAALALRRKKQQISYARKMMKALDEEFGDLPRLQAIQSEDARLLTQKRFACFRH